MTLTPTQNNTVAVPAPEFEVVQESSNNKILLTGSDISDIYEGVILSLVSNDGAEDGFAVVEAIAPSNQITARVTQAPSSGRIFRARIHDWWEEEQLGTEVVAPLCFEADSVESSLNIRCAVPSNQPRGLIGWTLGYSDGSVNPEVVIVGNDLSTAGLIEGTFTGSWKPGYYFLKAVRYSSDRNIPVQQASKTWVINEQRAVLSLGDITSAELPLDLT